MHDGPTEKVEVEVVHRKTTDGFIVMCIYIFVEAAGGRGEGEWDIYVYTYIHACIHT